MRDKTSIENALERKIVMVNLVPQRNISKGSASRECKQLVQSLKERINLLCPRNRKKASCSESGEQRGENKEF